MSLTAETSVDKIRSEMSAVMPSSPPPTEESAAREPKREHKDALEDAVGQILADGEKGGLEGTGEGDGVQDYGLANVSREEIQEIAYTPSEIADVVDGSSAASQRTVRFEDPDGGGRSEVTSAASQRTVRFEDPDGGGRSEVTMDSSKEDAKTPSEGQEVHDPSDQTDTTASAIPTSDDVEQAEAGVEKKQLRDAVAVEKDDNAQEKQATMRSKNGDVIQETNGFDAGHLLMRTLPYVIIFMLLVATSAPLLVSGVIHIGEKGFLTVLFTGMGVGIALVASFAVMHHVRQERREQEKMCTAAIAILDPDSLQSAFRNHQLPGWAFVGTHDKAEWLNRCVLKLWPHINKAASSLIKEQLQPILSMYTMGGVTSLNVKNFTLGNTPPRITGIRIMPGKGEVILEAKVDWRSRPQQKLKLEVKTIGPDFVVEVKKLRTYGVIHVVFTPLEEELPGFGAMLFALKEEPQVDFEIEVLGGEVTALPGVDKMIDGMIKTALLDMLVWPSRIVIPVGNGDYRSLQEHPVGRLYVVLREAKGLMSTDVLGKSDPFALLFVRQKRELIKRSTTKYGTLNPVWNEGFYIEVSDPAMQLLTVKIMDEEVLEKAEFVGAAIFPISQLQNEVPWEGWLDVHENPKNPSSRSRGRVHVQFTYSAYSPEVIAQKLPRTVQEGNMRAGGASEQDMGVSDDGDHNDGNDKRRPNLLWRKAAHVLGAVKGLVHRR